MDAKWTPDVGASQHQGCIHFSAAWKKHIDKET